jgi:hypothetical protein
MQEVVNQAVDVIALFDHQGHRLVPLKLKWQGRYYHPIILGLHHTVRVGRTLHHIFSVSDDTLCFRLNLNTDSLAWTLEEISDGMS